MAGLFLEIFNSANLWCWIASYPGRNEDTNGYRWAFFYGPLWIAIFIVTINLVLVFMYVRRVTLNSEKYATPSAEDDNAYFDQGFSTQVFSRQNPDQEVSTSTNSNTRGSSFRQSFRERLHHLQTVSQAKSQFARRRRQVANQCLRFALAFYCTWIPITIVRILQTIDHPTVYGLLVMAAMATPMQGLPNFIVYLYPLVMKTKKKNPKRGLINWVHVSLKPSRSSRSRAVAQPINEGEREDPSPSQLQKSTMVGEDVTSSTTSVVENSNDAKTPEWMNNTYKDGRDDCRIDWFLREKYAHVYGMAVDFRKARKCAAIVPKKAIFQTFALYLQIWQRVKCVMGEILIRRTPRGT
jgi:hypothetical protein